MNEQGPQFSPEQETTPPSTRGREFLDGLRSRAEEGLELVTDLKDEITDNHELQKAWGNWTIMAGEQIAIYMSAVAMSEMIKQGDFKSAVAISLLQLITLKDNYDRLKTLLGSLAQG